MTYSGNPDCLFEVELAGTGVQSEYRVSVRVDIPGRNLDFEPACKLNLSLDDLRSCQDDADYINRLTQCFFQDRALDKAFARARDSADLLNSSLRIRIIIALDAKELNAVTWELLGDSGSGTQVVPLSKNLRLLLSRYLRRPPRPLRQSSERLRSIVLIANPRKRNGRPLEIPNVAVDDQLRAVTLQLADETELCSLTGPDACKERLLQELRTGADIVYLVCHGQRKDDKPILLLETAGQEMQDVDGSELVDIIAGQLALPPQLVVLGSCQSAGGNSFSDRSDQGFLSSIGALMINAGVPAVIGMQGDVQQQTNLKFFETFFRELFADGQVERATAAARQAVVRASDWWMPTLLLSKEDGQLWPPHNARQPFEDWDVLLDKIETGHCTPILGSDVVRAFSNWEFAKKLLSEMHGEIGTGSSGELSWIAQQYKVLKGIPDVTERFDAFIRTRLGEDGIRPFFNEKLQDTVLRWGEQPKVAPQLRVLNNLASLPFRYYVTTNPDELLEQALKRANKTCVKQVCPWRGQMEDVQEVDVTAEWPSVYHLFGSLAGKGQERSSVVLTEDDFFEYLLWIASHQNLIPIPIKDAVCTSSLLFLGFHLRDWEFRILLRCIATMPGSNLLQLTNHAAVQIPLEGDSEKQRKTHELLNSFFRGTNIKLSIYYGAAEEFVKELSDRWRERHPEVQLCQQAHK